MLEVPAYKLAIGTECPITSAYRCMCVTRYHTMGDIEPQTIGDHSAKVAVLLMQIWPSSSAELIRAALLHDIGELITGDLPYYSKQALGADGMRLIDGLEESFVRDQLRITLPVLGVADKAKVKTCDYLDLAYHCDKQATRGADVVGLRGMHLAATAAAGMYRADAAEAVANMEHFPSSFHKPGLRSAAFGLVEALRSYRDKK